LGRHAVGLLDQVDITGKNQSKICCSFAWWCTIVADILTALFGDVGQYEQQRHHLQDNSRYPLLPRSSWVEEEWITVTVSCHWCSNFFLLPFSSFQR
jgi:hypothetical protein